MAVRYWQLLHLQSLSEVCRLTSSFSTNSRSFQITSLILLSSVYPTITSGKSTKVIIVSTPHGMNHFYRMWTDGRRVVTNMSQLMFTGQRFLVGILSGKNERCANTSEQQFKIEFECEFLGSVDTDCLVS